MTSKAAHRRLCEIAGLADLLPAEHWSSADEQALRQVGAKFARSLSQLLAHDALAVLLPPSWCEDESRLAAFFGTGKAGHSLSKPAHSWFRPTERQVTEGFAHFLNAGGVALRRRRAAAFLKALDAPNGRGWPDELAEVSVNAEQVALGDGSCDGRIDLLIAARDEAGRRVGAVIEAKLEHDLGRNPLPTYVAEAGSVGLTPRNASFLVVGMRKERSVRDMLSEDPIWRFQSWRRLLLRLDGLLTPEADDDEYRRFRSTLFHRCL